MRFDACIYEGLLQAVKENPSEKNVKDLAEWLDYYDPRSWNGEYYDADGHDKIRIFPIYTEIDEDEFEITGYELR